MNCGLAWIITELTSVSEVHCATEKMHCICLSQHFTFIHLFLSSHHSICHSWAPIINPSDGFELLLIYVGKYWEHLTWIPYSSLSKGSTFFMDILISESGMSTTLNYCVDWEDNVSNPNLQQCKMVEVCVYGLAMLYTWCLWFNVYLTICFFNYFTFDHKSSKEPYLLTGR